MRSLKLFSHILPYLLTMIFFWIDVSSFIILYHLTTQSLLCFFILQSVSHKPLNNLLFTLFFLALESQLAYGFFGLSLPIWIFIIPLGRFLAINFQLPFLSALGLLISALLTHTTKFFKIYILFEQKAF